MKKLPAGATVRMPIPLQKIPSGSTRGNNGKMTSPYSAPSMGKNKTLPSDHK